MCRTSVKSRPDDLGFGACRAFPSQCTRPWPGRSSASGVVAGCVTLHPLGRCSMLETLHPNRAQSLHPRPGFKLVYWLGIRTWLKAVQVGFRDQRCEWSHRPGLGYQRDSDESKPGWDCVVRGLDVPGWRTAPSLCLAGGSLGVSAGPALVRAGPGRAKKGSGARDLRSLPCSRSRSAATLLWLSRRITFQSHLGVRWTASLRGGLSQDFTSG